MKLAENEKRVQTICLLVLSAIALGVTLYFLSSVLIPFVLALFFSICLGPIMDFLVQRLHIPRTLAVVATMALSLALLGGIWLLVATSVDQMSENLGLYQTKLETVWDDFREFGVRFVPSLNAAPPLEGQAAPVPAFIGETIVGLVESLLSILSQGIIVVVFVFFLLIGRNTHEPTTGLWGEIESQVTGYLTLKVMVSAVTGLLVWGILSVLGVDLALVFGMFAFILNFIPNVGSVISTLLPVPVVLMGELSLTTKILAIALPAEVQFSVGNIVEPKLMGRSLDLHPVVVLFALIFWGILWGIIGVLLAVPITAVLKVLFEKTGFLDPVVNLMSARPPDMGKPSTPADDSLAAG